jgi:hypothetical protein
MAKPKKSGNYKTRKKKSKPRNKDFDRPSKVVKEANATGHEILKFVNDFGPAIATTAKVIAKVVNDEDWYGGNSNRISATQGYYGKTPSGDTQPVVTILHRFTNMGELIDFATLQGGTLTLS